MIDVVKTLVAMKENLQPEKYEIDYEQDVAITSAINALNQRVGKWKDVGYETWACDICDYEAYVFDEFSESIPPDFNFCPNCGAKMEVNNV